MLSGRLSKGWRIFNQNYIYFSVYMCGQDDSLSAQPSASVCPPAPGVLWVSCSWGGSSPAAAVATAGEGHRWSHFQRGSASRDVPQTQSKEHDAQDINKSHPIMWPECNVKWEAKRKSAFIKPNDIANKQDYDDISRPEAQSYLNMKDFSLSSYKEVSLQGREDAGKFC